MEYMIAAASMILVLAVLCLINRFRGKKQAKCIAFRKRKLSHRKRRSHAIFDRNRGKVIPFPANAVMKHNPKGSGSWQNKK